MANLSNIITPSNILTASNAVTLTNKTISGASNTVTDISLSTAVTGTLPVANGGTGAASLTANNVLLGNGTSAVQAVAPGTSGNVLTSNGTTWQSTAPAATGPTLGTPVATTSGTEVNFTGLPSTVKMIVVNFNGVRFNTSAEMLVQLGDSGGIETTGYSSQSSANSGNALAATSQSTGFVIYRDASSVALTGSVVFTLENATNNTWVGSGTLSSPGGSFYWASCTGVKSLSATLDRIRITSATGATFNLGEVNIAYF